MSTDPTASLAPGCVSAHELSVEALKLRRLFDGTTDRWEVCGEVRRNKPGLDIIHLVIPRPATDITTPLPCELTSWPPRAIFTRPCRWSIPGPRAVMTPTASSVSAIPSCVTPFASPGRATGACCSPSSPGRRRTGPASSPGSTRGDAIAFMRPEWYPPKTATALYERCWRAGAAAKQLAKKWQAECAAAGHGLGAGISVDRPNGKAAPNDPGAMAIGYPPAPVLAH